MNGPQLSIVIPAYKEAKVIGSSLKQISKHLDQQSYGHVEIIVVAADAGDGTAEIARKHADLFGDFKIVEHPSRVGKGRDVKSGMLAASGNKVIFMDADLATPLKYLPELVKALADADVAIGVRDLDTMHEDMMRLVSSRLTNIAVSVLAVRGIRDTQCGFKGFTREAVDNLFNQQRILGWGFDFEILALARKHKYRIAEVAIHDWSDPKPEGEGLVGDSQFSAMWSSLKELLKVRWNLMTRKYR